LHNTLSPPFGRAAPGCHSPPEVQCAVCPYQQARHCLLAAQAFPARRGLDLGAWTTDSGSPRSVQYSLNTVLHVSVLAPRQDATASRKPFHQSCAASSFPTQRCPTMLFTVYSSSGAMRADSASRRSAPWGNVACASHAPQSRSPGGLPPAGKRAHPLAPCAARATPCGG
jgi:hypothetical protein